MLSEKGSLQETPVLKLLLTVFEQGLTGILYLKKDDVLKVLYFSRGKLIWAISNSEEDKLENILLEKKRVDPDTLQRVKRESHISESIGKLLVEKGLLTLEELIESSRDQLKRIIFDVLKWKAGGFQFIKDAPPERLLSLDLNVTDFIIDFILEQMDIGEIWKAIGSLQIELIKNPDQEKLDKYNLSASQRQLLEGFDGENSLEAILSRHSGGHRESLLKIVYFFLIAELLIKKEFELADLSAFEDNGGGSVIGDDFNIGRADTIMEPAPPTRESQPEPDPSLDSIARRQTGPYTFDEDSAIKKETPGPGSGGNDDPFSALAAEARVSASAGTGEFHMKDEINQTPDLSQFGGMPEEDDFDEIPPVKAPPEEKKRMKPFNLTMLLIFLILVIGGVILLLLPWLEDDSPMENIVKKPTGAPDIVTIKSGTDTDTGTSAQTQPGDGSITPVEEKDTKTDQDKPEQKSETQTEQKKPEQKPEQEPQQKPAQQKPVVKKPPPPTPGKAAFSYFKEGNYITAADVWRREIKNAGYKYGVLLELDCKKESVRHAYGMIKVKKEFFILIRKRKNQNCFLVMWGKFFSQKEAKESIHLVPKYFWSQGEPPEVVPLDRYL